VGRGDALKLDWGKFRQQPLGNKALGPNFLNNVTSYASRKAIDDRGLFIRSVSATPVVARALTREMSTVRPA
jgi:hypothetical protein